MYKKKNIKTVKGITYFACIIMATITMFFATVNIVSAAETIKILSDNSWKSYDSLQAGWENAGFDDSAWRNAYAPYPFLSGYPPTYWIPGTLAVYMWDWPSDGTPTGSDGPNEAWFRKTFNLTWETAEIESAQAVINADDRFDFYVNGTNLLNDAEGVWSGPYTVDIKPYLIKGENVIAMRACDGCLYDRLWEWALVDATITSIYLEATIDVKPGSDPNSINLCSHGAVPVAIIGSAAFDVFEVDIETLRFAEAAVKLVGKKNPHALCSYEDVNSDFIDDLVCHFKTSDIAGIDDESTSAALIGELFDGTLFRGIDGVNVVKDDCN